MSGFYNVSPSPASAAHFANGLDTERIFLPPDLPPGAVLANPRGRAPKRSVALVSGGGSGHEPFATGLVAPGLLDAAIAGDLFASPTASAVARTLKAVTKYWGSITDDSCSGSLEWTSAGLQGICVIVLNYQGDRLNFSRAIADVTRHRESGLSSKSGGDIPVEAVIVADDISIPDAREPRGLAGVAFVIKVAGAASEQGRPFDEVLQIARTSAANIFTVGVALQPALLPNQHSSAVENSDRRSAELGLGIHNEPGAETLSLSPECDDHFASSVISLMCDRLASAISAKYRQAPSSDTDDGGSASVGWAIRPHGLAVLINNLGGVSELAMKVLVRAVADYAYCETSGDDGTKSNSQQNCFRLSDCRNSKIALLSGTLVSSLDMNGFSVTVLRLWDSSVSDLLLENVRSPWPHAFCIDAFIYNEVSSRVGALATRHGTRLPGSASGKSQKCDRMLALEERIIHAVCNTLLAHADELGALDAATGDGDFGNTIRSGCERIGTDLDLGYFRGKSGEQLCEFLANTTGASMGGTFGNMTSTFFEGCSWGYSSGGWSSAVLKGTENVMTNGRATVGDRTLVDALKPVANCLQDNGSVRAAAIAAQRGADSTKYMENAKFGRSSHVGARHLRGKHDPGALAVAIAMDAIASAIEEDNNS